MAERRYLAPKTSSPLMLRKKENGQFKNPPLYIDKWGGFTSAEKLRRNTSGNVQLEKGGPQSKKGKPF